MTNRFYDKIKVGDTVKKQLESDLQIELNASEELKPGIKLCLDELDRHARTAGGDSSG